MMSLQAPVGGHVSIVNGQFYKGGQFVPDHGLFCGKAGKKRQQIWNKWPESSRVDAGGQDLYEIQVREFSAVELIREYSVGMATGNNADEALAAFCEKTGHKLRTQTEYMRSFYRVCKR